MPKKTRGRKKPSTGAWLVIIPSVVACVGSVLAAILPGPISTFLERRLFPTPTAVTLLQDTPTAVLPTTSVNLTPTATEGPPLIQETAAFPTATFVPYVFDDFADNCISRAKWIPGVLSVTPAAPAPRTISNCFVLNEPEFDRHFVELAGSLIISGASDWGDELQNAWPSACHYRELQLRISDYSLTGTGLAWVGIVASNPEGGRPFSLWLSGRVVADTVTTFVMASRGWSGSPDLQDGQFLSSSVQEPGKIILGIRFTDNRVRFLVGNVPYQDVDDVAVAGYPTTFTIAYYASPYAELRVLIDGIYIDPETPSAKCQLTRVVP